MASISWNDLNDSSQLSAASSDEGPPKQNEEKQKNTAPTTLQKSLSSPQPVLKSHKFTESQRIADNLQKLEKHKGQTVWLYVMQNSNRSQQSQKILNDLNIFEKVTTSGKGLNVVIKTELAANYIEKGHQQNGFNFRFIYDKRNQPKPQVGKKIYKKYSEKHPQGRNDQFDDLKSPKIKSKNTFNQRTNSYKQSEKGQKKKVKYIAKDAPPKKEETVPKILQQIQQNSQPSNKQVSRTESKQQKISVESITLNESQQKKQKNGEQIPKQKIEQKKQEAQKKQQESKKKQAQNDEKQKQEEKTKFKKKDSQLSDDDEGQPEKQVKQKSKKHKKKKKGKSGAGVGSGSVDPNNRFSGLF